MKTILAFVLLLPVAFIGVNGGCGCRRSQQPPPCAAPPPPSSCESEAEEEVEVCTPCPTLPKRVCPVCPEPKEFKCRECPKVTANAEPCPVCAPQPVCDVCEVCPPPVKPPPCPTCPPPPPPVECPACPAPQPWKKKTECPSHQPPPPPPPCSRRPAPPQLGNDCCNKCGDGCHVRRRLRAHGAATLVTDVDPTCNSEKLRRVILEVSILRFSSNRG